MRNRYREGYKPSRGRPGVRRPGREKVSGRGRSVLTVCVLVAGVATAIVVVVISLSARPWRFDNYVVTGNRYLTAPEVVAATGLSYGANLFTTDFKDVEERLCRNPRIRAARVSRRIPGQLVLDIEERPACAAVVVDDELYKIAPDGVVLEELGGHYEDLPVLSGIAFSVRGKASGRVLRNRDIGLGLAAIGAIAAVDKAWAAEIDAVDVSKRTVVLADGTRRVRYDADFDEDVARRLRLVYGAVGESDSVIMFDVRFKNDVVVRGLDEKPAANGGGKGHGRQV